MSGKVTVFVSNQSTDQAESSQAARLRALLNHTSTRLASTASVAPLTPEVVPGDVVVGTDELLDAKQVVALMKVASPSLSCTHAGWGSERLHLLKCRGASGALSSAATLAATRAIASDALPEGVFVAANELARPTMVPNDPSYAAQWHYRAMNLPAAWDLTTGSTGVVVAVVDTGIGDHADLNGNLFPGYDMISSADTAGDGDGRDADPADIFGDDDPRTNGTHWHGTHCAGTIAAVSDNGVGVAGVAWKSHVVPVRALGKGGGTSLDIAAGITWAAGGTVPGVPANPHPAQVISLSLGGQGSPSSVFQTAIDDAVARGAIVVVAAGNENADTENFRPCNQSDVICVAATDYRGMRSPYSNYGAQVTIAAPGGDVSRDDNGDGEPDGVLSTIGRTRYALLQGTSMATPHVSGLVALMKALKPSLTVADVKTAFSQAATPVPNCATACGYGLVDAAAALRAIRASGADAGTPSGPGSLTTSAASITLTPTTTSQSLVLTNPGGTAITVGLTCSQTLTWTAPNGGIPAGGRVTVSVGTDLAITQDSTVSCEFQPSSGAPVPLTVHLRAARPPPKTAVLLASITADDQLKLAATVAAAADGTYALTAPADDYILAAASDDDGDGTFEDGEGLGIWPTTESPTLLRLTAGAHITGADFSVAPTSATKGIGAPCTASTDCDTGQFCGVDFPGGYCSLDCTSASCPAGSTCVTAQSGGEYCYSNCPTSGSQSTCRALYSCLDVGLPSGGVCVPQ